MVQCEGIVSLAMPCFILTPYSVGLNAMRKEFAPLHPISEELNISEEFTEVVSLCKMIAEIQIGVPILHHTKKTQFSSFSNRHVCVGH